MMDDMELLDRIDNAINGLCACGCGTRLASDGPSAWYASPACQRSYLERQTANPDEVLDRLDAAPVHEGRDGARVPLSGMGGTRRSVTRRRPHVAAADRRPPTAWRPPSPEDVLAFLEHARIQPIVIQPWQLEVLRRSFEAIGRSIAAAAQPLADALGQLQSAVPEQAPEHPMLRAIEARRNRNTGPKARQRAPRRIDARGAR